MRRNTSLDRWLAIPKPKPNAPLRLICLPYAGGNANSFVPYSALQELNAEICAVQLPGKGSRLNEAQYQSIDTLVEDLAEVLTPIIDKPYVIWGHSFGSRIGFELIRYFNSADLLNFLNASWAGYIYFRQIVANHVYPNK